MTQADGALMARLSDLARAAAFREDARFSRFLELPERNVARTAARRAGVEVAFFGGYPEAERAVAAFYQGDPPEDWAWPVACLRAEWNARYGSCAHRDLLGAEMALGLSRDVLGDIVLGEGHAYLYALDEVADYVLSNLESAGRCKLALNRTEGAEEVPEPKGRTLRVTLSSMRLDAVLAAAYRLSRADAQRMIERELIKLNHAVEPDGDERVAAGDVISARGLGRFRVVAEPAETRKGRLAVELFLYGEA